MRPVKLARRAQLILLAKRLSIGFPVWIEKLFTALAPCGLHRRGGDVPIRPALLDDSPQVLSEVLHRRPTKEPVPVVDLVNDESWLENDDMGNHRVVARVCAFGGSYRLDESSRRVDDGPSGGAS